MWGDWWTYVLAGAVGTVGANLAGRWLDYPWGRRDHLFEWAKREDALRRWLAELDEIEQDFVAVEAVRMVLNGERP